jgi:tetratricopeptide (TPR) repeat protein
MNDELLSLRAKLLRGITLSKQSSYARRSPDRRALPLLEEARAGLRAVVEQSTTNSGAWRLLSQAEECLMNYREAISCLETAMELSQARSTKDLKRLTLLKQSLKEWECLPLSPDELETLGRFLVASGVEDERIGRSLRFTTQWLREKGFDVELALDRFWQRGAYTDFQVLYNLVRG